MELMSNAIDKIASALVQAQQEMGNASKDSKNSFFKSKYADLNAVREASIPALNKYGISALQPTVIIDGKKFVQTMLLHTSGQFISSLTEILMAKEHDAQAQGSGISYARRYGLQSLVNIGAEDDDGEGAVMRNKPVSSSPVKETATNGKVESQEPEGNTPASPARRSFRTPNATKGEEL
jgi:ERF superfamily